MTFWTVWICQNLISHKIGVAVNFQISTKSSLNFTFWKFLEQSDLRVLYYVCFAFCINCYLVFLPSCSINSTLFKVVPINNTIENEENVFECVLRKTHFKFVGNFIAQFPTEKMLSKKWKHNQDFFAYCDPIQMRYNEFTFAWF